MEKNAENHDNSEQLHDMDQQVQDAVNDIKQAVDGEISLKEQLQQAIAEKAEFKDQVLRVSAEMENLRKRYEKQLDDMRKFAVTNFAKDLMSVMDNLHRALEFPPKNVDENPELKNIFAGVSLTRDELDNVFKKYAIIRIMPQEKDQFDYNLHQAASQIVTNDYAPDQIIKVMQSGYMMNDRLLRPAMVVVAKADSGEAKPE